MKRLIASILIFISMTSSVSVFAAQKYEMDEIRKAEIRESGGVITIDSGEPYKSEMPAAYSAEPEQYNNDISSLQYVSTPKNQGSYSACWSFASMSAFETAAMKYDNNPDGNYDFSEGHISVASSNLCLDENKGGYLRDYGGGGNSTYANSYITRDTEEGRYNGSVQEEEYPYSMMGNNDRASAENMTIEASDYFPQKFINISFGNSALSDSERSSNVQKIKEIVKEYGAAVADIYCGATESTSSKGFLTNNGDMVFYYNDQSVTANHSVCIVGYDDSYSKDNFSGYSLTSDDSTYSSAPQSDGAFIVKNSWGTSWGNSGYFYMSYETAITSVSAFGDIISRSNFDNIYETAHYSTTAATSFPPEENTQEIKRGGYGNVFTSKGQNEEIKYIGTYCYSQGTYFKFYVNPNADEYKFKNNITEVKLKNPPSEYVEGKGYYIDEPGSYIFELEAPVKVTGSKFTVAADVLNEAGSRVIPLEIDEAGTIEVNNTSEVGYCYASVADICDFEGGVEIEDEEGNKTTYDIDYFDVATEAYAYSNLNIKAYTKDIYNVTVDGAAVTLENDKLPSEYASQKLYTNTGNEYYPFDAETEISADIDLYTLENINAPYILANIYQTEETSGKVRFVGEVNQDYQGEISQFGFIYNDGSSKYTETSDELYRAIQGQDDYVLNDYAFLSAPKDAGSYTLRAFAVYGDKKIYSEKKKIG